MRGKIVVIGIIVLLITIGLNGCVSESPISKGNVKFTISDVIITNKLEIKEYFTNKTKNETSNDTKFVILSLTIENNENKWLAVQTTPGLTGLNDDEGNKYQAEWFVEINDSTYSVEQISLINKDEAFNGGTDIKPNSTELKKIVFTLPIEIKPVTLTLSYGFMANKETTPTQWFETEINIPS